MKVVTLKEDNKALVDVVNQYPGVAKMLEEHPHSEEIKDHLVYLTTEFPRNNKGGNTIVVFHSDDSSTDALGISLELFLSEWISLKIHWHISSIENMEEYSYKIKQKEKLKNLLKQGRIKTTNEEILSKALQERTKTFKDDSFQFIVKKGNLRIQLKKEVKGRDQVISSGCLKKVFLHLVKSEALIVSGVLSQAS